MKEIFHFPTFLASRVQDRTFYLELRRTVHCKLAVEYARLRTQPCLYTFRLGVC